MNQNPQGKTLFSIQQSADYLGVHKNTIRNLILRNPTIARRIGARIIRIDKADLDSLFSSYERGEFGCWKTTK